MRDELLPLFSYLMQDDQDTVRMLAADASVQFAKLLPRDKAIADVLPALHNASKDRSWRVRCVVAEKWAELQKSFGPDITRTDLVSMLVRLLQDQEPEVRSQTVARLPDIGLEMPAAERAVLVSTSILPHVTELCGDLCVICLAVRYARLCACVRFLAACEGRHSRPVGRREGPIRLFFADFSFVLA